MSVGGADVKTAVMAAIDDSWRELRRSLSPLTSDDMYVTGVCGEWSVKDVLGHVTTWEKVVLDRLRDVPLPAGFDLDAFNALEVASGASKAPREVMAELEATHRMLRDALAAAPVSFFEHGSPLRRSIDEDTVAHYDEHAQHIRAWSRSRKGG